MHSHTYVVWCGVGAQLTLQARNLSNFSFLHSVFSNTLYFQTDSVHLGAEVHHSTCNSKMKFMIIMSNLTLISLQKNTTQLEKIPGHWVSSRTHLTVVLMTNLLDVIVQKTFT